MGKFQNSNNKSQIIDKWGNSKLQAPNYKSQIPNNFQNNAWGRIFIIDKSVHRVQSPNNLLFTRINFVPFYKMFNTCFNRCIWLEASIFYQIASIRINESVCNVIVIFKGALLKSAPYSFMV